MKKTQKNRSLINLTITVILLSCGVTTLGQNLFFKGNPSELKSWGQIKNKPAGAGEIIFKNQQLTLKTKKKPKDLKLLRVWKLKPSTKYIFKCKAQKNGDGKSSAKIFIYFRADGKNEWEKLAHKKVRKSDGLKEISMSFVIPDSQGITAFNIYPPSELEGALTLSDPSLTLASANPDQKNGVIIEKKQVYVLEKPEGIIIDGDERDFGVTDQLHRWHAPQYIYFGRKEQLDNPQNWRGVKDLSGRIAIKIDDKYLYLFAEILDDFPMETGKNTRWEGDYLELYISPKPHQLPEDSFGYSPGDLQIQLKPGNGEDIKPSIYVLDFNNENKKVETNSAGCELIATQKQLTLDGITGSGWILEAKISRKLFPVNKNCKYIGIGLDIADSDPDKPNKKCFAAGSKKPYISVENFLFGFLYEQKELFPKKLTLGKGPKEYLIPQDFLPKNKKGQNIKIWDMDLATRKSLPGRKSICLDGLWGVQTFGLEIPENLDDNKWSYLGTPTDPLFWQSSWTPPAYFNVKNNKLTLKNFGKDWKRQRSRMFCREAVIPESWKGNRVFLDIANRGTMVNCKVFWNGKLISSQGGDKSTMLDVTEFIDWGKPNQIAILAKANTKKKTGTRILSLGDIWLHKTDKAASLYSMYIQPSVSKKNITIDFDLASSKDTADLQVDVEFYNWKTKKLAFKIPARPLSECKESKDSYKISSLWESPELWSPNHPNLYIARINLKKANGSPVDSLEDRFGFRETQIKGKELLINGIPFHLSATHLGSLNHSFFYDHCKALKKRGFNCVVTFRKPMPVYVMNWLDELGLFCIQDVMPDFLASLRTYDKSEDRARWLKANRNHPSSLFWLISQQNQGKEAGWIHFNYNKLGTSYFPKKGSQGKFAYDENIKTMTWADKITPTIPSILYCSGNQGPVSNAMTHTELGMPLQEAAATAETWAKTVDAKPLFLMESWAAVGTGINVNLARSAYGHVSRCWRYPNRQGADNILNAEELSQYLGTKAYEWIQPIRTSQKYGDPKNVGMQEFDCREKEVVSQSGNWWILKRDKTNIALHAIGIREHARSDRAYGLTGRNWFAHPEVMLFQARKSKQSYNNFEEWYLPINDLRYRRKRMAVARVSRVDEDAVPDFIQGGEEIKKIASQHKDSFKEHFKDATRPILVYIGGGPTPEKFRYKDHAYTDGEIVLKHVVAINDLERKLSLQVLWTLKTKQGQILEKGTLDIEIPPGKTKKVPLKFIAPSLKKRADCVLEINAKDNKSGKHYIDKFAIELFPLLKKADNLKVACFDSKDETINLLERLGVSIKKTTPEESLKASVLVIGRNSLSNFLAKATPKAFSKSIEEGLRVIVMEQNQNSVLGPWQQEIRLRNQFMKMSGHPILAGFQDKDFANWRGVSSLTKSNPEWEPASEYMDYTLHQEFGKWGNEGIVSTLPLRRQQHGNARTLLSGGFDQDWAALTEFHYGKGLAILSQLDITARSSADPVGDRIFLEMIRYATNFKAPEYGALAYAGGVEGKKWLSYFKADFTTDAETAKLLVVDATNKKLNVKENWLKNLVKKQGKTMLILWPDSNSDLTWLDSGMGPNKIHKLYSSFYKNNLAWLGSAVGIKMPGNRFDSYYKSVLSEKDRYEPTLKGITTEDLYYKFYRPEISLIGKVPEKGKIWADGLIAEFPVGKGRVILWQINPAQHKGFRSYKKSIRTLANLLTNNNVRLDCPLTFKASPLELSQKVWKFKTDPKNIGTKEGWQKSKYNDSNWQTISVGKSWESQGVTQENTACNNPSNTSYNGCAWYRINVEMPEKMQKAELSLEIGAVAGYDEVWLNGEKIGPSKKQLALEGSMRQYRKWYRNYPIPERLVKNGNNVIAIKVNNQHGFGGLSKWPVRIMAADSRNDTPLFPMEKNQRIGDPYRYFYW